MRSEAHGRERGKGERPLAGSLPGPILRALLGISQHGSQVGKKAEEGRIHTTELD